MLDRLFSTSATHCCSRCEIITRRRATGPLLQLPVGKTIRWHKWHIAMPVLCAPISGRRPSRFTQIVLFEHQRQSLRKSHLPADCTKLELSWRLAPNCRRSGRKQAIKRMWPRQGLGQTSSGPSLCCGNNNLLLETSRPVRSPRPFSTKGFHALQGRLRL